MLVEGARLGGYEVLGPLGAGGMGEVYRARDTRLGRDVALKILPDDVAHDPERRRRFEREARVLAALNDPGIAALFGLEEADGVLCLVMELVEGPTLAERLNVGPLRLSEALGLARQMADALAAAHERGILHRDLKPANVKITPEGRVKLLDFGLAKVLQAEDSGAAASEEPTAAADTTGLGVAVGTAPYMSPEQARGEVVDRRTDVWAFGCVLYEMLSGRRAFPGPSRSEAIAAVLEHEPTWEALPAATPPSIRKLLQRSLEKDRGRRLHDMGDARLEIEEAQIELSSGASAAAAPAAPRRRTHWLWAGGLMAAAIGGLLVWLVLRALPSGPSTARRLTFAPPPGVKLMGPLFSFQHLAVSPRGDRVAFSGAVEGEGRRLYLQSIDDIEAHAVSGTEGASNPFFSPDGRWLGFAQSGKLKKVLLEGGAPVTITDVPEEGSLRGASWGPDGTIVFSPGPSAGLWRVMADGGTPRAITTPAENEGEVSHRWPQILPGGKDVIFAISSPSLIASDARIGILSLETGKWRVVVEGSGYARYSSTGYLVYARLGALLAVPFDPVRLAVVGSTVPVLDDVQMNIEGHFYADFDISDSGALVYVPGFPRPVARSLLWVDRQAHATPVTDLRLAYDHPRLSPDGRRLAAIVEGEPGSWDLRVLDLARESWTLLTAAANSSPGFAEWSPDGRWLAFVSAAAGIQQLMKMPADGSASPERLSGSLSSGNLSAWSPDGRNLVLSTMNRGRWWDIGIKPLDGGEPRWLLAGPGTECCAALSPDGRFMAYVSTESGAYEVYVRPFLGAGEKHPISAGGGMEPRWSRDGRELFYRGGGDRPKLMAVAIETRGGFRAGKPRPLFDDTFAGRVAYNEADYDVAPDGRFLFVEQPKTAPAPTRLILIPGWGSELKAKLGAARP